MDQYLVYCCQFWLNWLLDNNIIKPNLSNIGVTLIEWQSKRRELK
jgi:hypothetical protein